MDIKSISSPQASIHLTNKNEQVEVSSEFDPMVESMDAKKSELQEEKINKPFIEKQAEAMNELLEAGHKSFRFDVHEELDRYYVQVVNSDTDEVIREIPSTEFLDMVASMLKHFGLLVDKRI